MVQVNFLNSNESKAILTGMQVFLERAEQEKRQRLYVEELEKQKDRENQKKYTENRKKRISEILSGEYFDKNIKSYYKAKKQQTLKSFTRFTITKDVPEYINIYYKIYEYSNGRILAFKEVENIAKRTLKPCRCVQLKEVYKDLPFLKELLAKEVRKQIQVIKETEGR